MLAASLLAFEETVYTRIKTTKAADDWPFLAIFILIAIGIAVFGIASLIKREDRVLIDDTWWNYYTLVQYDRTSCDVTIDSDGLPHTSCDTDTYTRCKALNSGRELPAVAPEKACDLRRGDYISYELYWMIMYHIQDTDKSFTKRVDESKWRLVQDGRDFFIETNMLGTVTNIRR